VGTLSESGPHDKRVLARSSNRIRVRCGKWRVRSASAGEQEAAVVCACLYAVGMAARRGYCLGDQVVEIEAETAKHSPGTYVQDNISHVPALAYCSPASRRDVTKQGYVGSVVIANADTKLTPAQLSLMQGAYL
jgi:hypothetical protein